MLIPFEKIFVNPGSMLIETVHTVILKYFNMKE